jgi:DNA-binding NarL/FixJ family response regulator
MPHTVNPDTAQDAGKEAAYSSMPSPPVQAGAALERLNVLIVEDNPQQRDAFAESVMRASDMHLVGAAANGRDGLRLLDEHRPDVLLVDLDLPDIRGVDLIKHAARHLPDCDVMVVTVFGDERSVVESIESGATGYLLKDAMPDDFVGQIRALRAGGSPISPFIARRLLTRFQPLALDAGEAEGQGAGHGAGMNDERVALSEREHSVLSLVAKGFSYAEIADMLTVSPHTVTTHVKRIYRKLQVRSKTEAVYEARKLGLLRGM